MKTRITKWGNSLAVRITQALVDEAGLREGEVVKLQVLGPGRIEIRSRKSRPTLERLTARITSENRILKRNGA